MEIERIGKIKFSNKFFILLYVLAASTIGYVIRIEVKFALVSAALTRCEKRVTELEEYTGLDKKPEYRCGPPCDTGKEKRK